MLLLHESEVERRFTKFVKLEKMLVDNVVATPFYKLNNYYTLTAGYTMSFDSFN